MFPCVPTFPMKILSLSWPKGSAQGPLLRGSGRGPLPAPGFSESLVQQGARGPQGQLRSSSPGFSEQSLRSCPGKHTALKACFSVPFGLYHILDNILIHRKLCSLVPPDFFCVPSSYAFLLLCKVESVPSFMKLGKLKLHSDGDTQS